MAIDVVLPMAGITAEQGMIVEWLKAEGDSVEKGEIIFVAEFEKATFEVESPASGILAKILVSIDEEIPVKSPVAIITEPGEELPSDYKVSTPETVETALSAAEPLEKTDTETVTTPDIIKAVPAARIKAKEEILDLAVVTGTGPGGVILLKDVETALTGKPVEPMVMASTLARSMAEKESVPLDQVQGTGVRDRIMKKDVQAFMEKASSVGPGLGDIIPMSRVRKVVARRMSESAFTAPHIYFFTDICLDPLLDFRKAILPDFEKHFNLRPSVNDFLIKAVALNILDFPMLNAQLKGEEIHIMSQINIGLAVAVTEGLIVPAIARADVSGLVNIVRQRVDLVEKARQGKLSLEEMERGTFTISSLAGYDITHFTAILNPPQSGILSVGKTDEKLVMKNGEVVVTRVAQMGLSVDHRIIDGAQAADFLQNLKWKLERPSFTFINI